MKRQFWRRKLMAFLHDPPSKPLDIAGHKEVAESIQRRAGLDLDEMVKFSTVCDHTAAAADRFPFPKPGTYKSTFTGARSDGTAFRHPLGDSCLFFDRPFASADDAEGIFQVCQPGSEVEQLQPEEQEWARFFLHWRRWPELAAGGQKEGDWRTLFLPADTRVPDHNVWTHNSVVSALQGCVTEEGELSPAFLIFQLGPVQEFIAQARSTRDLWSGSYMLSWLMAHALRAVTDEVGPDSVIFPALRGQPLFDLLHRERLYNRIKYPSGGGKEETLWQRMGMDGRMKNLLTPTLPNRFLAVVPAAEAAELGQKAEGAVQGELVRIGEACWKWFEREGLNLHADWRKRYENQSRAFPKIGWQVSLWGKHSVSEALDLFRELDAEGASSRNLQEVYTLATQGVPEGDRDGRYFRGPGAEELNNPGFCWSYYYTLTDWLLAARRRTRDFAPWTTDEHQAGAPKDSLSGVEEVVGDENWWETLRQKQPHFFRSQDRLGAVNLLKRVWHIAYLSSFWNLDIRWAVSFDSVPAVAASIWRRDVLKQTRERPEVWHAIVRVREALIKHKSLADKQGLIVSDSQTSEEEWFNRTDPGCFIPSEWDRVDEQDREAAQAIQKSLREFYEDSKLEKPPVYYAVLVLDGDEMGKWVSGEKTPELFGQLSLGTRQYFQRLAEPGVDLEQLQRPLSPSYHLQFSEALSNFGLYLARPIVEHFGGQLIYSGGDDVLAMVPAASALECAEALWMAFRGDKKLEQRVPGCEVLGERGGFIRLTGPFRQDGEAPSWPLVVPGPRAQASVGIAIGHIHTPLQGLVQAAREAEKRAKEELGRAACAVSLFKRSGEILEWGFKWNSGALELYRIFIELSNGKEAPLSSRFGYALRELLRPYAPPARSDRTVVENVPGFPLREVVKCEFHHVLARQGSKLNSDGWKDKKERFVQATQAYLDALEEGQRPLLKDFPGLFDTANFITRGE